MAEPENSLFDIEVDADDYADAAAEDNPAAAAVDRTHQSEADFLKVKENYEARQDGSRGSLYEELLGAVPSLSADAGASSQEDVKTNGDAETKKAKLDKRSQLLLGYVVGELWYDGEFKEVERLCGRVEEVLDGFLKEDDADVASGLEKATASEFGRWKQFAKLWKWEPWLSPSGSPNCASTACSSRTSGLIFFSVKALLIRKIADLWSFGYAVLGNRERMEQTLRPEAHHS
ncbi:hypothetical protein Q7P36_010500 [Cladosporium allicinum]